MKQLQNVLLLLLFAASVSAQERSYPSFQMNGNFQVGIPLNDFRDNLDEIGFGGGLQFLMHLGDSPLAMGADLSILAYATEHARFSARVGGFTRNYELRTTSHIFLGHAMARFQPRLNGPIHPYIDGMLGFKNLFTSTSLTDRSLGETLESDTDQSDWALSYGGAFGIQISFGAEKNVVLDLRCAYLPGQNATYLVRREEPFGGFEYDDPIEAFEERTSLTNLLLPQIGVTFRGIFNKHRSKNTPSDSIYDYR